MSQEILDDGPLVIASDRDIRSARNANCRAIFLEELAASSHIARSAKKANVPLSTIYHWRAHDPDFSDAWLQALNAGYALLEMEMLGRLRDGVERKFFRAQGQIETVREYKDGLALRLLQAHKAEVTVARAAQAGETTYATTIRTRLEEKLNLMRRRGQRQQAVKQADADIE